VQGLHVEVLGARTELGERVSHALCVVSLELAQIALCPPGEFDSRRRWWSWDLG
jgi:hypothetical protein